MKEIKFRYIFKSVIFGDISIYYFTLEQIEKGIIEKIRNSGMKGNGYEIMAKDLYTGQKDKNGKEIYGGDILDNTPQMIKICWDTISGRWFGHYLDKKRTSSFWMGEEFKKYNIAGNMHENPELLKEK